MEKVVNGVKYHIPNNLTAEQTAIYIHIIDWKRKNITTRRGLYGGHEYDAIFPNTTSIPAMMYQPEYTIPQLSRYATMQRTRCYTSLLIAYKALTNGDKMFSSFTNYDILNSINTKDPDLQKWINWYKDVYCF